MYVSIYIYRNAFLIFNLNLNHVITVFVHWNASYIWSQNQKQHKTMSCSCVYIEDALCIWSACCALCENVFVWCYEEDFVIETFRKASYHSKCMDPQRKCVLYLEPKSKTTQNFCIYVRLDMLLCLCWRRVMHMQRVAFYTKTCVYVMILWLRHSGKHCITRIGLFTCVSGEFIVFSECAILHAPCPWSGKLRGKTALTY